MSGTFQFDIRTATHDDVPELEHLIECSVRELQANDYSPAQIEGALGFVFGVDRQLLDDGTYFVATPVENPSLLVGCGGWSYRRTLFGSDQLHGPVRDGASLDPATDFAKIRAFFVHPKWVRLGVGSLLLRHCEAAATAAGFSRFEMGSTRTGYSLYQRLGYVERGRKQFQLPNGENMEVILMNKELP